MRRAIVMPVTMMLIVMVFVSTERARPYPTALGMMVGVEPLATRLDAISDGLALAHRMPDAGQRALVRRAAIAAPLDALPYYIAAAGGDRQSATANRRLIAMALQRDPRLRPALSWTIADRAKANDVPGLTRALIRLAVLNPGTDALWDAVAKLSVDPAARAIVKTQLRRDAPWRDVYLRMLSASPIDRAVVFEMVEAAGRLAPGVAGTTLAAPVDRQTFLTVLMQRKEYERAYLAWVQWLPTASQDAVGYVFDGAFRGRSALSPFAWALPNGTGGAAAIDAKTGLSLDYSGAEAAVAAQQVVLLPPGRYRIVAQGRFDAAGGATSVAPLSWTLTCLPDATPLGELAVPLDGVERRVGGAAFAIPASACTAQTLMLRVNPADFPKRVSGTIRSVAIEAIK